MRNAIFIAEQPELDGDKLNLALRQRAEEHWRKGRFFRMLNRMLFRGADGADRYKILERFYRLQPSLIERFYAGNTTLGDMARILSGKPPISIGRAIKAIWGKKR